MHIYIFTYQKSSWILGESWCRTWSGMGEIEKYLQYPSNTPKYITSVTYLMLDNWVFDILFWMHNDQNLIIKIFITLCAVLFPYVPLEGVPTFLLGNIDIMSLGSTKLENCPWNGEQRVKFQLPFFNDCETFRNRMWSFDFVRIS